MSTESEADSASESIDSDSTDSDSTDSTDSTTSTTSPDSGPAVSSLVVPGRPEAAAAIWRAPEAPRPGPARRRAVVQGLLAAIAGAALFFWIGHQTLAIVAWSIGGVSMLAGLVSPLGAFAAIEKAVGTLGHLVGLVMSWLLLAPVFYLLITPFGLLARRGKRDAMQRRFDRSAETYWKKRDEAGSLEHPY